MNARLLCKVRSAQFVTMFHQQPQLNHQNHHSSMNEVLWTCPIGALFVQHLAVTPSVLNVSLENLKNY